MIRLEVVEKISKYFRLTQYEAEKVFDDIFSVISQGVKEDNIVDIANFGEFITKHSDSRSVGVGSEYEDFYVKTVEFLAASNLQEELNPSTAEKITMGGISDDFGTMERSRITDELSGPSVEDELRKKRETLLSKISIHPLQDAAEERKRHESESNIIIPPVPGYEVTEPVSEKSEEKSETVEGEPEKPEEVAAKEQEVVKEKISELEEDLSRKSFSDYFAEVRETGTPREEVPHVLPKTAVDLHNEIMGTSKEALTAEPVEYQAEKLQEVQTEDKSYYIWYKDSQSSPADTQSLSYEYELLYQATKEAEYKSKLRIYVTTFILFFSMVLALLIFSPLIYKVFFSPVQLPGAETLGEKQNLSQPVVGEKALRNIIQQEPTPQVVTVPAPVDTAGKRETPPVTGQTQLQQDQAPVTEEPRIEGLVKNAIGWTDEKLKVIYVKLESGRYLIQESSWDSDAKANNRIALIESLKISGFRGSIEKVEVSGRGTWYRVRFGEFSNLQEARRKAEELRNRVKV